MMSSSGCTAILGPENPTPAFAVLVAPQVTCTRTLNVHLRRGQNDYVNYIRTRQERQPLHWTYWLPSSTVDAPAHTAIFRVKPVARS